MADAVPFCVYGGGQILDAHGAASQKMGALSFGGSKTSNYIMLLQILDRFCKLEQKIKILEKRAELIVLYSEFGTPQINSQNWY